MGFTLYYEGKGLVIIRLGIR